MLLKKVSSDEYYKRAHEKTLLQNTLIKIDEVIPDQLVIFDDSETAPGSPSLQGLLKII